MTIPEIKTRSIFKIDHLCARVEDVEEMKEKTTSTVLVVGCVEKP